MLVLVSDLSHAGLDWWSLSERHLAVYESQQSVRICMADLQVQFDTYMVSNGCRASRVGLTAWMPSGVQLLMDMQLKCYTLKGAPSLFTGHCTKCPYAFFLCPSRDASRCLPA